MDTTAPAPAPETAATAPATLFTLPAHLRASIAALVGADIAPPDLQDAMRGALAAADVEELEDEAAPEPEKAGARPDTEAGKADTHTDGEKADEKEGAAASERDADADAEKPAPPPPQRKPPTVDGTLLDALAAWAGAQGERIAAAGLDPADYSFIGLLAGTEVYLPPRQRALAAAADRALADREKTNPFLPAYLSPAPPSLGSEYRQLSRQVATVLNVLFSVFGVGGGVYYAARSVGWPRERAVLLGILGGVVVGIADSVLVWIFKVRLTKDRRDTARRRVRMNKGSAGIPGSAKVLELEGEGGADADGDGEVKAIEAALVAEMADGEEGSASATPKRTLRLRRKPLS